VTALKIILYLVSGVLTAPGTLLAFFFWNVDSAARQKGLLQLLGFAFFRFLQLFDWLFVIILPVVILWLLLAFVPKYRVIGEGGMATIGAFSLILMFALGPHLEIPDDLFFPIISVAGFALNLWLIWMEVTPVTNR
jgi:hypothetical protein